MQIVGGIGVPHTPHFPRLAAQDTPLAAELGRLYGELRTRLAALEPDLIVFVTADHYNLFFVESVPIFSIGIADRATGPSDYRELEPVEIAMRADLARRWQAELVGADFDVGCSQEYELDHPFTIPLQFIQPGLDVPIVPLWISAFMPPLPSAGRCRALGARLGAAIRDTPGDARVVVLATGSFSLDIGGPRMSEDSHTSVPAPEWVDRVLELMRAGDLDALVAEATSAQIEHAGSAAGEVLLWIAMLATLDDGTRPEFLEAQPEFGHAYGAWRTEVPAR